MPSESTPRILPWVSATLTIVGTVIAHQLTESLSKSQSWGIILAWVAAGIIVTYSASRLQIRSPDENSDAMKERVSQLEPELRAQVQTRSYGARRNLIEAPLRELELDITPRVGWVRDPRLLEPEPVSEKKSADDIVAAFESSKRRLLIVGEPGSGKTMSAYSLIEYLDETEGDQRMPLLVNLSAWEAQDDFEAFLVDYLSSSVGYQVRQRAVAEAFVKSRQYSLILDGLDEIPAELRTHFSESLDKFISGLPSETAVVVTCRTKEYDELLDEYRKDRAGLGLVQAVEILPLTDEQLDHAFLELAKRDENWEAFLSQRHLTAYERVRHLLSNPLFLNLAVVGHISPDELLDSTTTEEGLRDLVLDRYLDRTLANQRDYEPGDARRYLSWIARFLDGEDKDSPFGLKTSDATVFDLASLTPTTPPWRFRLLLGLFVALFIGWVIYVFWGLVWGLVGWAAFTVISVWVHDFGDSARSADRLTFYWPASRQERRDFLSLMAFYLLVFELAGLFVARQVGMFIGLASGLVLWLVYGLVTELLVTPYVLISYQTPKEARSHSLINGLVSGLASGLVWGLAVGLVTWALRGLSSALVVATSSVLIAGLLRFAEGGGWFVLLQKVADLRLDRADSLPPHPEDFLDWGIEQQIFRRVGGGVRFRHSLLHERLVNLSEGAS